MPNTGNLKVTTPSPDEIVLTRVFDAPWRMVYDAFTKPELIKRWFGAKRGTDSEGNSILLHQLRRK